MTQSSFKLVSDEEVLEQTSFIDEFARDVFLGFNKKKKEINSKYLYDTAGSEIYERIMELPEYYLVRSEYEILNKYKSEIAKIIGNEEINVVELGSGNGFKTNLILEEFLLQDINFEYIPIDISRSAMEGLVKSLNNQFPKLKTNGLVGDYFDAMNYLAKRSNKRNLVMFLGSNIGNFLYDQSMEFLYRLWTILHNKDYLFSGFDLRKDLDIILPAYNDSQGVTAEFNYNLLTRMNSELGANFDINLWKHYEPYDVYEGAVKSYLISLEDQDVNFKKLKRSFQFKKWEPIHIEQSYKYTEKDIDSLAEITGYQVVNKYYDKKHYFCNALWVCEKSI